MQGRERVRIVQVDDELLRWVYLPAKIAIPTNYFPHLDLLRKRPSDDLNSPETIIEF